MIFFPPNKKKENTSLLRTADVGGEGDVGVGVAGLGGTVGVDDVGVNVEGAGGVVITCGEGAGGDVEQHCMHGGQFWAYWKLLKCIKKLR